MKVIKRSDDGRSKAVKQWWSSLEKQNVVLPAAGWVCNINTVVGLTQLVGCDKIIEIL